MPIFTKESLQNLKHKIDLIEVITPYVDLKKQGTAYKGLCPFHEEKSPSFTIQRGDTHFHCFGCGAHGDAIQFLMNYLSLSFGEACENLSQRFHSPLEIMDKGSEGVNTFPLKEAMQEALLFYHAYLLYSEEGQEALKYLEKRNINRHFIETFAIGLAPKKGGLFLEYMKEKRISQAVLEEVGLLSFYNGSSREFFQERILFPIFNPMGAPIGFSGRKYKEDTYGGKYVNSKETPLFKKSRILYGLNYTRRRISKEGKAIIVEGQIDALRLIYEGFDCTVASQGTAFGEGHVKELLNLGTKKVYLCFDSDTAGQKAALKVGDLFQAKGVEVKVILLPPKMDPDLYLKERGKEAFQVVLEHGISYLSFVIQKELEEAKASGQDPFSPAVKNDLIERVRLQIVKWEQKVMVHESLKFLAKAFQIPEELLGVNPQTFFSPYFIKKESQVAGSSTAVNPDIVLEEEFLAWFFFAGNHAETLEAFSKEHQVEKYLKIPLHKEIYAIITKSPLLIYDTIAFLEEVSDLFREEASFFLSRVMKKPYRQDKIVAGFQEVVLKILLRRWMEEREILKNTIQSGLLAEEEALSQASAFNRLCQEKPLLKRKLELKVVENYA